ncbi:hypothetical protein L3V59_11035 [Burkholderia aenigmatica]|uniref:hypothetical protein n=1 Tax=Burkholderia aenigmatica TaxID=2015348 RepID=UPI001F169E2A|nr:hypothetical protein [Burkholderia aenigmatica]UKD10241.1 hypothetical protein L3V59_11035 [Burkholderia aenigmatica]
MKPFELDVVIANPPCQGYRSIWWSRRFVRPELRLWSINLSEEHAPELTGQARADFECEARIQGLDSLMASPVATPLWQRVCKHAMYSEIRARSADQRLVMELAILESMR